MLALLQPTSESSTIRPSCPSQRGGCVLVGTRQVCGDFEAEEKWRFVSIPVLLEDSRPLAPHPLPSHPHLACPAGEGSVMACTARVGGFR